MVDFFHCDGPEETSKKAYLDSELVTLWISFGFTLFLFAMGLGTAYVVFCRRTKDQRPLFVIL